MNEYDSVLFDTYYNTSCPAGFSSADRLFNFIKHHYPHRISKQYIINWLQKQKTYTLHKDRIFRFKRNHYNITNIDDLWEMDLIEMQNFSRVNRGHKFILAVIDCFSRFAWCVPIKRKTPAEVIRAINIIFNISNRKPYKIQSDKGREFVNKIVQKFFIEKDIDFVTTRDPKTKAAICERFIRTIKGIIYKYFTYSNTHKYIDVLDSLMVLYNDRFHTTIGRSPSDVNESNVLIVWSFMNRKRSTLVLNKSNKFNVDDIVRVSNPKETFGKGYKPKWSQEIFTIVKVHRRNPVVYNIKDSEEIVINGNFYESELQKIELK